ncbi:hypothetical protein Hdeb2414_s0012g00396911 [Helianthus debilis subsp. tardiflorus]
MCLVKVFLKGLKKNPYMIHLHHVMYWGNKRVLRNQKGAANVTKEATIQFLRH